SIMRWMSSVTSTALRTAWTTIGPNVITGTNLPSITSRWMNSAPPSTTACTSSASRPMSAVRMLGAMITGIRGRPSSNRGRTWPPLVHGAGLLEGDLRKPPSPRPSPPRERELLPQVRLSAPLSAANPGPAQRASPPLRNRRGGRGVRFSPAGPYPPPGSSLFLPALQDGPGAPDRLRHPAGRCAAGHVARAHGGPDVDAGHVLLEQVGEHAVLLQ